VVRFFILRAHYRSPLNYSDAHLEDARSALGRLYTALKSSAENAATDWSEAHALRFKAAMDDDFNTPEAVAALFDLAGRVNAGEKRLAPQLRALGGVLGILQRGAEQFFQGGLDATAIEAMIVARKEARLAKGVVLEDGPRGTTWRRA
jgi:cysteinyl-tRNA synthetase